MKMDQNVAFSWKILNSLTLHFKGFNFVPQRMKMDQNVAFSWKILNFYGEVTLSSRISRLDGFAVSFSAK